MMGLRVMTCLALWAMCVACSAELHAGESEFLLTPSGQIITSGPQSHPVRMPDPIVLAEIVHVEPWPVADARAQSMRRDDENAAGFHSMYTLRIHERIAGGESLDDSLEVFGDGGFLVKDGSLLKSITPAMGLAGDALFKNTLAIMELQLWPPGRTPENSASFPGDRPLLKFVLPVVRDESGALVLATLETNCESAVPREKDYAESDLAWIYENVESLPRPSGAGAAADEIGSMLDQYQDALARYERATLALERGEIPQAAAGQGLLERVNKQ